MIFNIVLLIKLFVIIITLIFLPLGYFFLRVFWFSLTIQSMFECRIVNFYVLFYLYKIILIFLFLNIWLFLAVTNLLLLITLINLGIVY
jgi:hypothetical protein